ncbi:hypothetical protein SBA2_340016 [Acidobacteriia bacterium SbA2]|nr:hypothetical protein SBA2_340016 [Acidobacteriia bacterium SbA2]
MSINANFGASGVPFDLPLLFWRRHPESGAVQPGEGSRVRASWTRRRVCAQDPSLRLKNGSAQDDALRNEDERDSSCDCMLDRGGGESSVPLLH